LQFFFLIGLFVFSPIVQTHAPSTLPDFRTAVITFSIAALVIIVVAVSDKKDPANAMTSRPFSDPVSASPLPRLNSSYAQPLSAQSYDTCENFRRACVDTDCRSAARTPPVFTAQMLIPFDTVQTSHLKVFIYQPLDGILSRFMDYSALCSHARDPARGAEKHLYEALLRSDVRVLDPAQATAFFIPNFSGCLLQNCLRADSTTPDVCKRVARAYLLSLGEHVRHEYPFFNRSAGVDHVVLVADRSLFADLFGERGLFENVIVLEAPSVLGSASLTSHFVIESLRRTIVPLPFASDPTVSHDPSPLQWIPPEDRPFLVFFGGDPTTHPLIPLTNKITTNQNRNQINHTNPFGCYRSARSRSQLCGSSASHCRQ